MTAVASDYAKQLANELADCCDRLDVIAVSEQGSMLVLLIDEADEMPTYVPDSADRSRADLISQVFEPVNDEAVAKLRKVARPALRVIDGGLSTRGNERHEGIE